MLQRKGNISERTWVFDYVAANYGTQAEYLWANDPLSAVLRHTDNRKWYAVVLRVPYAKLGLTQNGETDVINVKCDPVLHEPLRQQRGIVAAYHMNKRHWITALLDGSVPRETVQKLLDMSFTLTANKKKSEK